MGRSDWGRLGRAAAVFYLGVSFVMGVAGEAAASGNRVAIVADAISFHGGEILDSSLSKLRLCSKSGCYDLQVNVDDGLFRIDVAGRVRDHHRRVRITNKTVEHWQDGVLVEVVPERERGLRNWVMARVYFVFLPYRLLDESAIHEDLGSEIWEGRSLRKVKVTFAPGSSSGADDEFLYWFDPSTARLEQFAYSFSGNPGGLRFRKAFNFRRIDGVLFFDQENWGLDGDGLRVEQIEPGTVADWDLVSTVTLDSIEILPLDN